MLQFGLSAAKLRIYVAILNSIQCNSLFLSAVEKENHVDIIICGGGASGLLLANGLVKDPAFDQLNILLLEKDKKTLNDRTWCFWEEDEGEWEELGSRPLGQCIVQCTQLQRPFSHAALSIQNDSRSGFLSGDLSSFKRSP